jgi:hypothetical protein
VLTAASPDDAFITELLYNRLYSLMWTQGTRWVDARRYDRTGSLPIDRPGDVVHPNMLIPSAECDARGLSAEMATSAVEGEEITPVILSKAKDPSVARENSSPRRQRGPSRASR